MSDACLCRSTSKIFLLNSTAVRLTDACNYESSEVATDLERQDYEVLGNCLPPQEQTDRYAIRLTYNPRNENHLCKGNATHRYFWGPGTVAKPCVDGVPLDLPTSFQEPDRCYLANVQPGSSNKIFHASWTRCNQSQSYICQLQSDEIDQPRCTDGASITPATTTTATSNNNTSIIIGSVSGVGALFIFSILIYVYYKTSKRQNNLSNFLIHKLNFKSNNQVVSSAEIYDNPIYSSNDVNLTIKENSNAYEIAAEDIPENNETFASYETPHFADINPYAIGSEINDTNVVDHNQQNEHGNPYDHLY